MKKDYIDFGHLFGILKKMNATRLNGVSLMNSFFIDSHNIWQAHQQKIFGILQNSDIEESSDKCAYKRMGVRSFLAGTVAVTMSLLAFLGIIIKRKKILVYSIDKAHSQFGSDSRLDEIYKSLKKHNIAFTECFHTLLNINFRRNIVIRKRSAIYLEAFDFLYLLFVRLHIIKVHKKITSDDLGLEDFSKKEDKFIVGLIDEYVYQSRVFEFKVAILSQLLRLTGVTHLLAIDDSRSYFELLLACKKNKIKTFAFQHGHFSKYHVGWLRAEGVKGNIIKPDKLFVWSEYWKNELLRLGTYFNPDEIVVGGVKNVPNMVTTTIKKHRTINILVPHERAAPKDDVRHYIEKFLDCGAVVFFKTRPGIDRGSQLSGYGLKENKNNNFVVLDDLEGVIETIDIVAGTCSTFLYDMIAYNKTIVFLNTKVDYGEGVVKNNLAEIIDFEDDVCRKLSLFISISDKKHIERREKLFGKKPVLLADTLREILERV